MITQEERHEMRRAIYEHLGILLGKVHKMFESSSELTIQQMIDASDILKDLSSADKNLSKACYYDSMRGGSDDRKY